MIHVLTTHVGTDRWVAPQRERLARHTSEPYRTWAAVGDGGAAQSTAFDRTFASRGLVGPNLDHMASVVASEAHEDDLLVFLDGDAFPIDEWVDRARVWLAERPLAAVRRDENLGDPQPHQLFCVTTVGFWSDLRATWAKGPVWSTTTGRPATDHGARLWRLLNAHGIAWHPILRSNQVDLHPVWFGVYGDVVYHHGAGLRFPASRWDGVQYAHLPGPLGRAARWRRVRATARLSSRLADEIAVGDGPIDRLRGLTPTSRETAAR